MASGMARGLGLRNKRAAFGDGRRIIFGPWSEEIFRYNPNVARPGEEGASDLVWIAHYKGNRLYNGYRNDLQGGRWVWNYGFRVQPGEIFFDDAERKFAEAIEPGFVLIEPNVPWNKSVAPNKDWGHAKYQAVTDRLQEEGRRVVQFARGERRLKGVEVIATSSFRLGLAALSRAALAVLPEGGLHHGAAAVNVPAVVIFGGFIPPAVTGYDTHVNLTGGTEACGSLKACPHCAAAMAAITVDEVFTAAVEKLKQ